MPRSWLPPSSGKEIRKRRTLPRSGGCAAGRTGKGLLSPRPACCPNQKRKKHGRRAVSGWKKGEPFSVPERKKTTFRSASSPGTQKPPPPAHYNLRRRPGRGGKKNSAHLGRVVSWGSRAVDFRCGSAWEAGWSREEGEAATDRSTTSAVRPSALPVIVPVCLGRGVPRKAPLPFHVVRRALHRGASALTVSRRRSDRPEKEK